MSSTLKQDLLNYGLVQGSFFFSLAKVGVQWRGGQRGKLWEKKSARGSIKQENLSSLVYRILFFFFTKVNQVYRWWWSLTLFWFLSVQRDRGPALFFFFCYCKGMSFTSLALSPSVNRLDLNYASFLLHRHSKGSAFQMLWQNPN